MDVSDILNNLNDAQRKAVTSESPHLLVLAGAGSGKTRVIAHRVAWLVQALNNSPYSLLTVTFTNKAANEMKGRIESMLGQEMSDFWCGTFHGISHRLLRRHWEEANLRREFAILDSEDQYRVIKRVCKSMGVDVGKWPARQIQWYINKEKDECRRANQAESSDDYFVEQMTKVYVEYELLCERESLVDFGELLLRSLILLSSNESLLSHYQKRFKHILVDEFQDTNEVQYQLLSLLKGKESSYMAVGDDDQSIYGWRGAKSENIDRFTKDFSKTEVVRLEQNYRSTQTILSAANSVIENNRSRMGKELWTEQKEGEKISIYSAYNEDDEARYVVGTIQSWMDQGNALDDAAILYRSNAQSRALEEAIIREGLPYRIYGGQRFYERAEIKNAMAYIRLVYGREDDAAFERVINLPPRGIGAKTLEIIRNQARDQNCSLWRASTGLIEFDGLTARASSSLSGFIGDLERLQAEVSGLELKETVDHVIQRSGLIDYHKKEAGEKGRTRIENLDELVSAAGDYEPDIQEEDTPILKSFIDHAALDAGEDQAEEHESAIQLMTLHSAKGLEFPLIFITGFEENLFPHRLSIEEPGQLEEERRLCYVGMTRAMEKLYIIHAEMRNLHGNETFNPPSRFLREIPPELTQEIRTGGAIGRKSYDSKGIIAQGEIPETDLVLGQRVVHEVFGEGVILNYEGQGANARVEVNFDSSETKWLMASYAKLRPI